MEENEANSRYTTVVDPQGIIDEFHKAFQKIYKNQDVDHSSEAIQDFLVMTINYIPNTSTKRSHGLCVDNF